MKLITEWFALNSSLLYPILLSFGATFIGVIAYGALKDVLKTAIKKTTDLGFSALDKADNISLAMNSLVDIVITDFEEKVANPIITEEMSSLYEKKLKKLYFLRDSINKIEEKVDSAKEYSRDMINKFTEITITDLLPQELADNVKTFEKTYDE